MIGLMLARRGGISSPTPRTRLLVDDSTAVRASIKPIIARLGVLAKDPTDSGISLKDSQREFRDLLERQKLLAAVVLPLREESALARRYAADLKGWNEAIDRESRQALEGLALDLVGVVVALAVVFVGGVLWRVGVIRSEEHTSELQSPCNLV